VLQACSIMIRIRSKNELWIVMNWIELLYHVTRSMRIYETRVVRRRVIENLVKNIIEKEELRKHKERIDIFWEKNIFIEHYALRKHLSWERLDLICVCFCCNLLFFIDRYLRNFNARSYSVYSLFLKTPK